jgi:hypothetical protein
MDATVIRREVGGEQLKRLDMGIALASADQSVLSFDQ